MSISKFQFFSIESSWLTREEKRYDAEFYTKDAIAARVLIDALIGKGLTIDSIGEYSGKLFWPGRFKRKYTGKKTGIPFLTPGDAMGFLPKSRKFVFDVPENVPIKKNWILITRSGTIGRSLITTSLSENFVFSDDLIRIIPKEHSYYGYLYAYLNTWVGQAFLTKNRYGATVKHIESHHVADIPFPRIPEIEETIHNKIIEVQKLREEGQNHLIEAETLLYKELQLPIIDDDDVIYFDNEKGKIVKCFEIQSGDLDERFDASYHLPILKIIRQIIEKSKSNPCKLGTVLDKIFIPTRFKRPYVNSSDEGIPFLQGSHIPQIKPLGVKYIWKKMKGIENTLLKTNWVLMTRSGTVGKIGFVSDFLNGWAGSEHILRLIIKSDINPGYIAAFLISPYGEYQIKGKIYGAVVDEIGEHDTSLIEDIDIILPEKDIQDRIGTLVIEAFRKKDKANLMEDRIINQLESIMDDLIEN